jgi:hypothetical protein
LGSYGRQLWPDENPDFLKAVGATTTRWGKTGTPAAKLHSGTLGVIMWVWPVERRMSLSLLNFKIGVGAGRRIAWLCCGRSNAIFGSGSRGRASAKPVAKGKTSDEL